MEHTATCRLCGRKVSFKEKNPAVLGAHLITKHPDVEMTHFRAKSLQTPSNSKCRSFLSKTSTFLKRKRSRNSDRNGCPTYKTTVEVWRPGSDPIECPKCGNNDHPMIRRQKNKVANNPLIATCLAGCWPICFLPLGMCGKTSIVVCCKKCGFCFGTYDPAKGKLNPSPKDKTIKPHCSRSKSNKS